MRPLKGSGSEKRTPRRGSRGAVPERGVGEVGLLAIFSVGPGEALR